MPPAPREPSEAALKVYSYRLGEEATDLAVGIAAVLLGLIFGFVVNWHVLEDLRLDAWGAEVEGAVKSYRDSDASADVRVDFVVDGQHYVTESSASKRLLGPEAVQGRAVVQYLPSDPDVARVRGGTRSHLGPRGLVVFGVTLIGLVLVPLARRSKRRRERVFREGVPVQAQVVSFDRVYGSRYQSQYWRLRWEFRADGHVRGGALHADRESLLRPFADAGEVTVLMLPGEPSFSVLWVE